MNLLSPQPRLASLTGVRFIAALTVLASHLIYVTHLPPWTARLHSHGRAGVCFFFILSGFILTYTYRDRFSQPLRRSTLAVFARARFARIYPMYVLTLLLITPLVLKLLSVGTLIWLPQADVGRGAMAGSWLSQILLIQPYFTSTTWEYLWNVPGWSVACEVFFYAIFPFLIAAMNRRLRSPGMLYAFAVICLIAQYAGFAIARSLLYRNDNGQWQEMLDLVAYKLPVLRMWEFMIGCCAGLIFLDHRPRFLTHAAGRNALLLACLAIVAVNVAVNSRTAPGASMLNWYVLYTPIFATMILCLACGSTLLSWALESPLIVLLGESSYALYLIHWAGVLLLHARFGSGGAPVAVSLLVAIGCIAASVVLHRRLEIPARLWLRGGQTAVPEPVETMVPDWELQGLDAR